MKQEEKTEKVMAKKPYRKPSDQPNISEIWYQ